MVGFHRISHRQLFASWPFAGSSCYGARCDRSLIGRAWQLTSVSWILQFGVFSDSRLMLHASFLTCTMHFWSTIVGNVSSRIEELNRLVEQQKAVLAIALIQNDEFHSFSSDLAPSQLSVSLRIWDIKSSRWTAKGSICNCVNSKWWVPLNFIWFGSITD